MERCQHRWSCHGSPGKVLDYVALSQTSMWGRYWLGLHNHCWILKGLTFSISWAKTRYQQAGSYIFSHIGEKSQTRWMGTGNQTFTVIWTTKLLMFGKGVVSNEVELLLLKCAIVPTPLDQEMMGSFSTYFSVVKNDRSLMTIFWSWMLLTHLCKNQFQDWNIEIQHCCNLSPWIDSQFEPQRCILSCSSCFQEPRIHEISLSGTDLSVSNASIKSVNSAISIDKVDWIVSSGLYRRYRYLFNSDKPRK